MKTIRLLTLTLTLALLLLCACVPALAEEEPLTCGDFQYRLTDDGGAVLVKYTGPEGEVVIPNQLDGHPVTDVQRNPFFDPYKNRILNCTYKVARDHPSLATIDGVLFCKTDRRLVCYPPSAQGPYEIPQGIESIGYAAFSGCIGLTSVTIPDSVTSIGYGAFAVCTGLTSVTIPDSVTSIGEGAFYYCTGLTSVTIPDSVTSIGELAFAFCSGLTGVTIPDSVTSIGKEAFCACAGLKAIAVSPGNPAYTDLDGVLYTKTLGSIVAYPGGREESAYRIPGSVTSIGDYAFFNCTGLTSVTIPDSVTSIGEGAFAYCGEGFTVTCGEGSYAEAWCGENRVAFVYPQPDYTEAPDDWLN